jgi:branched-subunit amino acid ABC-type transport system permease component
MGILIQIISLIAISSSLYTLISSGFNVIFYTVKFFHIAHAITLTFSAYFTYLFSIQLKFPIAISIPLAILCATAVGMLSEIALYKPLRKRNASPMILMIASLGLYTVLQNVISMLWGDDTKSVRTGEVKVGNEFLGAYITDIQIITIAVCLALFVGCVFFMKYSRIGRNIRAVASNPELSNVVGIHSDRVILWAFGIGSALAAVAGILIAFDTDMRPTMGFSWLLYGVVAMIIGGVGSNWGLVGGALLLATAQHLSAYYIGSQWMDAVAYIILILFLIARPLGFSGKRLKKIEI